MTDNLVGQIIAEMTSAEKRVLAHASDGEMCYAMRRQAQELELPLLLVRRIYKRLATNGLVQLTWLVQEDSHQVAGRGYIRTRLGDRVLEQLD